MTADMNDQARGQSAAAVSLPPEPPEKQFTPEEKARILARLTLQLAALGVERRSHGNA
jgi:hypothetical protein